MSLWRVTKPEATSFEPSTPPATTTWTRPETASRPDFKRTENQITAIDNSSFKLTRERDSAHRALATRLGNDENGDEWSSWSSVVDTAIRSPARSWGEWSDTNPSCSPKRILSTVAKFSTVISFAVWIDEARSIGVRDGRRTEIKVRKRMPKSCNGNVRGRLESKKRKRNEDVRRKRGEKGDDFWSNNEGKKWEKRGRSWMRSNSKTSRPCRHCRNVTPWRREASQNSQNVRLSWSNPAHGLIAIQPVRNWKILKLVSQFKDKHYSFDSIWISSDLASLTCDAFPFYFFSKNWWKTYLSL